MADFDALLWDVDGTLLDFLAAEAVSMQSLFKDFGLGDCTQEMIERYSAINAAYWKKLERKELTRAEILVGRFEAFFSELGLKTDAAVFNEAYQKRLGETAIFRDNSYELVSSLKGKIPQYVVSNGTVVAQTGKLKKSGFDQLVDGIFLSEKLGADKPSSVFFQQVFDVLKPRDLSRLIIIGDSLSSDIAGGINAGIKTCWYNPMHAENNTAWMPDFEIENLLEVRLIINI